MADFGKIVGTRGITVNIFEYDNENSIALRLMAAILDEYHDNQRKADEQSDADNA